MTLPRRPQPSKGSKGVALVLVTMAVALLSALGLALSLLANIEMRIAGSYSHAQEAMSAAETGPELTAHELLTIADWDGVASGQIRSALVDGPPAGSRILADGASVSLPGLTSGLGDSSWRLFAHGPAGIWNLPTSEYVVVWARNGASGAMVLRADALGSNGARRAVQASVTRSRVLSWGELR